MLAFPQNGWENERVNWAYFLDQFDAELFPLFQSRGYTKNAALQAYFVNVLTTAMYHTMMKNDDDEEEGEQWRPQ